MDGHLDINDARKFAKQMERALRSFANAGDVLDAAISAQAVTERAHRELAAINEQIGEQLQRHDRLKDEAQQMIEDKELAFAEIEAEKSKWNDRLLAVSTDVKRRIKEINEKLKSLQAKHDERVGKLDEGARGAVERLARAQEELAKFKKELADG